MLVRVSSTPPPLLLLLLQVFYISCFLGSLVFLVFTYVAMATRRRQPISTPAAAADESAALNTTNQRLLPWSSASSNTDQLMVPLPQPAHYLYLKVGLVGTSCRPLFLHIDTVGVGDRKDSQNLPQLSPKILFWVSGQMRNNTHTPV